ncbi:glycosyl hydrolase [Agriterribacter sp.]|uniref:glycosyl hydrolase n=1 Tax=Agriterribacter sp. TaxID=2821509 RepID=UPI002C3EA584|nr:glycosyl hydrolase [Agriterribacter sp.]HRO46079.1 glycosyl hydrolase [Agriterribacter sp.]HRQ16139.1 glycosyl hydrolase [Agriterribacter sp.]
MILNSIFKDGLMFLLRNSKLGTVFISVIVLLWYGCNKKITGSDKADISGIQALRSGFVKPPDAAKPGVYWYFMDGNLSEEGMTKDLESMAEAGIGNLIFLEVNVGVPRGRVDFLSDRWLALFAHAEKECRRLNIAMTLGIGPGWSGSGGPWVAPEQSMQHLVSESIVITGNENKKIKLTVPPPRRPFFGEGGFTPDLKKQWQDFYEDVAVLAFPQPAGNDTIKDIDEKALYYRAPYSSVAGVKSFLASFTDTGNVAAGGAVSKSEIIDLTGKLHSDGTLDWEPPRGNWIIMRFGRRNNGAVTRPAPFPGLGFEADKFDTVALNNHLDEYTGRIFRKIGKPARRKEGGLKFLHMDSWEMGAQNWTKNFRTEFIKRRGYDPLPFYPVYNGVVVESPEISERFLWDLRQTGQELVLEYHAGQVKKYSHRHGLGLSIEPYDMNPNADLELGAVADVPMCEFWSKDFGYNTSFSCIEAVSVAHVNGQPLVPAEAFTAEKNEGWKQHPGSMKAQGDWAFATGINRFVYHTFQSQSLADSLRPGMTMGPYGIHWDRNQTWWPMVADYHRYISRCQFLLQQGRAVADILYLTPEGAPHVFRPPSSALTGEEPVRDRRGYNFDGCSPGQLLTASVKDNQVVFPGGASYKLLVLPDVETMTPRLLEKIRTLVYEGAIIVGSPPVKSPGLTGYPGCDEEVKTLSRTIWGSLEVPPVYTERIYGKGKILWGAGISTKSDGLYPLYNITAQLLKNMNLPEDFEWAGDLRYTHRTAPGWDIYFVANKTDEPLQADAVFRCDNSSPELWDPVTGEMRSLPAFMQGNGQTSIPLQFEPHQSFFIVFKKGKATAPVPGKENFPEFKNIATLNTAWTVSFDPKWGGPEKIIFDQLEDWTTRPEEGIKYYSGIAVYSQRFDLLETGTGNKKERIVLDLGEVKNLARVKLNGKDLGVIWTAPWQVDITGVVKQEGNELEIAIANLWPNRLIGDEQLPDDGIKNGQWPEWLLQGTPRTSGRFTFTTFKHYKKDAPLLKSGLIGPVTIKQTEF